jgi:hypothetical protein
MGMDKLSGAANITGGIVFTTGGEIRSVEVALTSAQVKALRATPITIVPAPGAGKAVVPLGGAAFLDYGSNVFTESTDNLALRYENGSGAICSGTITSSGFITASADTMTSIVPKTDAIVAKTVCENKAIVIHNTGDGEIAGNAGADNVVRIKLTYLVLTTGW